MRRGRRRLAWAVVAALLVAALSAWWLLGRGGGGARFVVGSKSFTESVVLGEIARQAAERAGVSAAHKAQLRGTRMVFDAVVAGAVDAYPEYTGTLVREVFADRAIRDPDGLRDALAGLGLGMTEPIGFNNTYAIGVLPETARRLGLRTIGDLADHPELTLGFTNEFIERADGWRSMRDAYGLPHENPKGLDHDLAYAALAGGAIDAKEVYTTDARIADLGLVVLEDDRRHFPRYDAVWVYRLDLAERLPGAMEALRRLTGVIDERDMVRMNAAVEIGGRRERAVAANFLDRLAAQDQAGVVEPAGDAEAAGEVGAVGLRERVGRAVADLPRTTRAHAVLVGVSMGLAIAVAVPLGVLAARHRAAGQVVLAVSGLLQTIPSIALLALLVSVLAVANQTPAILALFVYSLLPIVRTTHAGLTQIPQSVRDSALSLGLPMPWTLLAVELPLALPAIFAGIKTAAVINVGTATLGGFVAAGGYGEPIFAGIRRSDEVLILAGLIPAALMAVALTLLLDLAERLAVGPGLRGASRRRAL